MTSKLTIDLIEYLRHIGKYKKIFDDMIRSSRTFPAASQRQPSSLAVKNDVPGSVRGCASFRNDISPTPSAHNYIPLSLFPRAITFDKIGLRFVPAAHTVNVFSALY